MKHGLCTRGCDAFAASDTRVHGCARVREDWRQDVMIEPALLCAAETPDGRPRRTAPGAETGPRMCGLWTGLLPSMVRR